MAYLLPLPRNQNRGGRGAAYGGRGWRAWGLGGGQGKGEKGEEEVGVRFPYLARAGVERGRLSAEAGGGGRAECGGGAGSLGRELGAAVEVVGEMSCAGSLFIGGVGRWRRS